MHPHRNTQLTWWERRRRTSKTKCKKKKKTLFDLDEKGIFDAYTATCIRRKRKTKCTKCFLFILFFKLKLGKNGETRKSDPPFTNKCNGLCYHFYFTKPWKLEWIAKKVKDEEIFDSRKKKKPNLITKFRPWGMLLKNIILFQYSETRAFLCGLLCGTNCLIS